MTLAPVRPGEPVAVTFHRDEDLLRLVAAVASDRPILAGDLTLGSWRGHWLARELAAQLGLDLPTERRPVPGMAPGEGSAPDRVVAGLIDLETAGDGAILTAHAMAQAIGREATDRSIGAILVLGPPAAEPWMPEDAWLVRFLARLLDGASPALIVAMPVSATSLPCDLRHWEIPEGIGIDRAPLTRRLADPTVPGLVPPGTVSGPLSCVPTLGGWSLLLPGARATRAERPTATPEDEPLWLQGCRHATRSPADRNPRILAGAAALAFSEGGYRQALRLVEAARDATTDPVDRAMMMSQAQSMRIAAMDFAGAAAQPDPDASLPPPLLRDLSLGKAWGLVMTGRPAEAGPLFDRARNLAEPQARDPMWLYLLNISALNKLRLGQVDAAFSLEHRIERTLAGFDPPDWHLSYINFINLARLHRHAGHHGKAHEYYQKAFAINEGLRSDSDHVYLNVCQAGLERADGRLAEALLSILRASLHWLAMEVPEALAPRVARAMKAEPGADLVARTSEFLRTTLVELLGSIGHPFNALVDAVLPEGPAWRRPSATGEEAGASALGAPGWGVLVRPRAAADRAPQPCQQPLAGLVAAVMRALAQTDVLTPDACVVVDAMNGTEVPTDLEALFGLAARRGCRDLCFRGRRAPLSIDELRAATADSRIALGPGVDGMARGGDEIAVFFRRSRDPIRLAGADLALVEMARDEPRLGEAANVLGRSPQEVVEAVSRLEAEGVLRLTVGAVRRAA